MAKEKQENKDVEQEMDQDVTVDADAEETVDTDTEEKADATEDKDDEEAVEESTAEDNKEESTIKNQLIRLQADFENFKKRSQKEKTEMYAFAMETLMTKLLPVIDNLERAEGAADDGNTDSYREGVQMVFKELMGVLEGEGLKEIDAQDQSFDPNFHHGVAIGNEDEKDDQQILEVFQKGYQFKDKVIRAAMVKVNQK